MKNELDFPEKLANEWFEFYGKSPKNKGYDWDSDSKMWSDFMEEKSIAFNEMSDIEKEDFFDLVRGHGRD